MTAIQHAVTRKGMTEISARSGALRPSMAFELRKVQFQILSGFATVPSEWEIPEDNNSYQLNASSLLMKVTLAEKSVIIMGDALGVSDE